MLQDEALDPHDPRVWFRLLVDAVDGLHHDCKVAGTRYLQFVEKHRSREVALQARRQLRETASAESWRNTQHWIANGYVPKDPPKNKEVRKWR